MLNMYALASFSIDFPVKVTYSFCITFINVKWRFLKNFNLIAKNDFFFTINKD